MAGTPGDEESDRRLPGRAEGELERALASSRIFLLLPVAVLVAAALGAFVYGTEVFVRSIAGIYEHPLPVGNKIGIFLVVVDLFLIGATLLIAAIGFYELFISRVEGPSGLRGLPEWLEMRDLNDLKARVVSMIVLVVAVSFADVVVDFRGGSSVLYLGAGVALVIAALTAFVRLGREHGR